MIHDPSELKISKNSDGTYSVTIGTPSLLEGTKMRTQKSVGAMIVAATALLFTCTAVFADEPLSDSLQRQVDVAVAAARQHDFDPTDALKNQGALPYFEKYATDPSEIVRMAVVEIAAADHTAEAVKVLTPLVKDPSVGVQATDALYEDFDKPFLGRAGGDSLKTTLLSALTSRPHGFSRQIILLLTCFPNDASVIAALKNLKQEGEENPAETQGLFPKQAVPVNLALSELGDAAALRRVQATIQQGDIDLLPVLLDDLKFVDNRATLTSLVPLLDDKRFTKDGIFVSWGFPLLAPPDKYGNSKPLPSSPASRPRPTYFRVCDIALLRLTQKTGVDIWTPDVMTGLRQHNPILSPRNYTDAELNQAYLRLNTYFSEK